MYEVGSNTFSLGGKVLYQFLILPCPNFKLVDNWLPFVSVVCVKTGNIRKNLPGSVVTGIDYRWDKRRFWLSAHNCQVPTPTSQNLEFEQQIRIFGAD
jgi:hypothetical protein